MLQIVLIRPGSTEFDQQGRVQGTLDLPLCAVGHQQAERLAAELRGRQIEAVYACDCEPARETAGIVAAALRLKVKKIAHLTNLDHGLWQGMLRDDIRHKHPKVYRQWQEQPEALRPPEGETVDEAGARVAAALGKLEKKHKQGVIALVVPEPLAAIVHHRYRPDDELGGFWNAAESCGSWELLSTDGQPIVHRGVPVATAAPGPADAAPPAPASKPRAVPAPQGA